MAVARAVAAERVALTGGCFQNRLLVERAVPRLRAAGIDVLLHRAVPPGDGGVSLGQIVIAAARLEQERDFERTKGARVCVWVCPER